MKIFAAGIATESSTYSPIPTGIEDFRVQRHGDPIEKQASQMSFDLPALWGRPAQELGHDFVFSLMAKASPSGVTVRVAYESLRDEILDDLRAAMPVDIVLLMLHGAMLAEGYEDCEEDIIRKVRSIIGTDAVLGVELDLHCHLSASKIEAVDLVVTFKEYPHVDVNDRARELFVLAIATRLRKVRPVKALFDCRMIGLFPTTRQPMRSFVDAMCEAEKQPGVLSISFGHGFQWGDVPHMGSRMLVITDNDQKKAESLAAELGRRVHAIRQQIGFHVISLPLDQALIQARGANLTPVVVADQSDNVGTGAPGDSTFALQWLLEHGDVDAAIAIVYDPEVVRISRKAGVGSTVTVRLGGKLGPSSGWPVDIRATVVAMRDRYSHVFPQGGGRPARYFAGDVVALRCRRIDIVVSSERCQCFDPSVFVDLGIDPLRKHVLIVKSTQHFYGAFAPIASEVIYMSAPGAAPPDPQLTQYRRFNTANVYPWTESPFGS